ncbi:hypothetical protein ANCCAN_11538 [Ancylostoma caninum]|uniref:Uncharacterized protein n=1 Tax=Ancylostoma caninum TaxID=29170 RepID=A0A368GDL9_ANCCA|nr:hypothetical protein ANCCAN_11538 [Ancylostoma caninum]
MFGIVHVKTSSISQEADSSAAADANCAESTFELDVNSNYNDEEKEPLADISEVVQGEDEEGHENGTEETAEVDDEHDTKQLDSEDVNTHDNKTPEPPVSFDKEPADKVPADAVPQPQVRNYHLESDTDSLTGLTRPDFQMPTRKRTEKKERSKKPEDEHRRGSRRSKRVYIHYLTIT